MSASINTQKLYARKISKLRNTYKINDLNEFEKVMSKINTIDNDGVVKLYIASIIWWNKYVKKNIRTAEFQIIDYDVMKKYKNVMNEKSKKLSFDEGNALMTERQKKMLLPWDKIIQIRELINNDYGTSFEKLIVNLYTCIPPRRLELIYMYYVDKDDWESIVEDPNRNYCVNNGKIMFF